MIAHVSAARVHEDVLRMARTEKKRELIKWLYARRFLEVSFSVAVELAKQSTHEDARLLVSLFSAGAPVLEAAAVCAARSHDACAGWP